MRDTLLVYAGKFKHVHELLDKGWRLTLGDIKRIREYQRREKIKV